MFAYIIFHLKLFHSLRARKALINMAVAFPHISWWLWSGKHQEPKFARGSPLNSSTDANTWEFDNLKFPLVQGGKNVSSNSRRTKKKWPSRKERKVDREYDIVVVPSDGGCVSGSESDDSDWSIGWLEPHGPGFPSDDESDGSFAVLVPCYGRACMDVEESPNEFLEMIGNIQDMYASENKRLMEQWLSSLQRI